jgi:hypothetical protein
MLNRRSFALMFMSGAVIGGPALAQSTRAQSTQSPAFVPNNPLYAASLEVMQQKRWKDLVSGISELPPQSAYALLRDLGDGAPISDKLEDLSALKGGKGIAGAIHTGWAWRFRGSYVDIKDEGGFVRHLTEAGRLLMGAIEEDRDDGVAASYLFEVLKGSGEAEALHGLMPVYLAAKRKPVEGLSNYTDAVSEKWAGSEAESLAFARRFAGSQPAASFGVIPFAHINTAVARGMSSDPRTAASAERYLQQPAVTAEIIAAHDAFVAAKPDPDTFAMRLAHAQFSLAFLQLNDLQRARHHLAGQGRFAGGPWRAMEDGRAVIEAARTAVGLESAPEKT